MRLFILMFAVICAMAAPAATVAADLPYTERITRLPVVGPIGADGVPSAYVSDIASSAPPGQPFYARAVVSRNDHGDDFDVIGWSSLPFQISWDPVSGRQTRLVYSQCAAPVGSSAPTCAILALPASEPPVVLSDPPAGTQDRLPSGYGGAAAFARITAGAADELRYVVRIGIGSQHVWAGPSSVEPARLLGVALRGATVASLWRTTPAAGRTRTTLVTERVGGPRRTIVSLDAGRGQIIGPFWRGARLVFAVRRGASARLYDYAPRNRAFRSAAGPTQLASFAIGEHWLFWQTASGRALRTGTCSPPGCSLFKALLPSFHNTHPPH
jgi:hypothetical protein